MIEAAVERHLIRRVKELGGEVRKVAWPGRRHAPDRLVLLPSEHFFVELKRPAVKACAGQLREHERLRAAGCAVFVANTKEQVEALLP